MVSYIIIRNHKFFLWDRYPTWRQAYNEARVQRRKHRSRYFILKKSGMFGIDYELYFNNISPLF